MLVHSYLAAGNLHDESFPKEMLLPKYQILLVGI